jgi:hypothetical protein
MAPSPHRPHRPKAPWPQGPIAAKPHFPPISSWISNKASVRAARYASQSPAQSNEYWTRKFRELFSAPRVSESAAPSSRFVSGPRPTASSSIQTEDVSSTTSVLPPRPARPEFPRSLFDPAAFRPRTQYTDEEHSAHFLHSLDIACAEKFPSPLPVQHPTIRCIRTSNPGAPLFAIAEEPLSRRTRFLLAALPLLLSMVWLFITFEAHFLAIPPAAAALSVRVAASSLAVFATFVPGFHYKPLVINVPTAVSVAVTPVQSFTVRYPVLGYTTSERCTISANISSVCTPAVPAVWSVLPDNCEAVASIPPACSWSLECLFDRLTHVLRRESCTPQMLFPGIPSVCSPDYIPSICTNITLPTSISYELVDVGVSLTQATDERAAVRLSIGASSHDLVLHDARPLPVQPHLVMPFTLVPSLIPGVSAAPIHDDMLPALVTVLETQLAARVVTRFTEMVPYAGSLLTVATNALSSSYQQELLGQAGFARPATVVRQITRNIDEVVDAVFDVFSTVTSARADHARLERTRAANVPDDVKHRQKTAKMSPLARRQLDLDRIALLQKLRETTQDDLDKTPTRMAAERTKLTDIIRKCDQQIQDLHRSLPCQDSSIAALLIKACSGNVNTRKSARKSLHACAVETPQC